MATHNRGEVWTPIRDIGYMRVVCDVLPVYVDTTSGVNSQPTVRFQVDYTGNIEGLQIALDTLTIEMEILLRKFYADHLLRH